MAYTDSAPVVAPTLALQGVWIHDPDVGGEATARSYPYGASQRSESIDTMGEAAFYAGRIDPVIDYGEHEVHSVAIAVDVPHGATWRADVESLVEWSRSRKALHIRDNRGRALYGYIEGLKIEDADWGTRVSFAAVRAHHDQAVM